MKKKSITSAVVLMGSLLLSGCSSSGSEPIDMNDAQTGINTFYNNYTEKISSEDFNTSPVNDFLKSKIDHKESKDYSATVVKEISKMSKSDLDSLNENINKTINLDDFVEEEELNTKQRAILGYMLVADSSRLASLNISPEIKMADDAIALTGDNKITIKTDAGDKVIKEEKGYVKAYSDSITDASGTPVDIMNLDVIYFDKNSDGNWKISGKETIDMMESISK